MHFLIFWYSSMFAFLELIWYVVLFVELSIWTQSKLPQFVKIDLKAGYGIPKFPKILKIPDNCRNARSPRTDSSRTQFRNNR